MNLLALLLDRSALRGPARGIPRETEAASLENTPPAPLPWRYLAAKLALVTLCLGCMALGLGSLGGAEDDTWVFAGGLLALAAPLVVLISTHREMSGVRRYTAVWYRANFPQALRNGKLACRHCGHTRIRAQRYGSFHRACVCAGCNETLFYVEKRNETKHSGVRSS